ncbi:MAG: cysteine--tRNA ligase [Deltaproteobacteria bacterium]|nr:cysteine--tRNA ligase [Deltaproteobacteria bacterium]
MPFRIHNTLAGRLEEFVPLVPGKVGMYVCGVTVYDRSHIGHARAMVVFDVLYRYLRFAGYDVTFIRNFTDVDDKIIARANHAGISTDSLVDTNIRAFAEDIAVLGCLPPTLEPRATQHIPEMIALIEKLIAKGLAYPADGDVYFAVDKLPGYGKLSKRNLDDMQAGARIEVDERKHHPMDFALWKASKPGEPWWDSPWGRGRPGWHIECSVMASKYLDQPFDIHGGGNDLIFPHHENEIAQSEGAHERTFARYWVHNGMVTIDREKMSKSLGNFMTVQAASQRVGGEAVRLFVIGTHYRSPLDFAVERLDDAAGNVTRIYETLARADAALGSEVVPADAAVVAEFRAAMDNDLNTAGALGVIFDTLRALNRALDQDDLPKAAPLRVALREMCGVLGFAQADASAWLERARRAHLDATDVNSAAVERLIAERNDARKARNFKRADEIRAQLKEQGIVLEDTPSGTKWKVEKS